MYIKSLPGIEATEEDQLKRIEELEKENEELGRLILQKVEQTGMKKSYCIDIDISDFQH